MASVRELSVRLRNERLLDMEGRLRRYRMRAFAVIAVTLAASGPWLGYWPLAPLAALLGAFALVDRMMRRSDNPGRWAATGWALSTAMIALVAALTGGPESPAVMGLAMPIVTLGARFDQRGVIAGVVYVLGLLLIATLGVDAGAVADAPDRLIIPAGLVVAMAFLTGATVQSERDHRRDASLDQLTGLLNRSALAQRWTELDREAAWSDPPSTGVLVGDLDHFKRINDDFGHPTGDEVLKDVAYTLRNELRSLDLVYRVGGEEFVVILPDADLETTRRVGERLRETVARTSMAGKDLTMSFGASAGRGEAFSVLYEHADAALYAAKRAGRNRVGVAGEADPESGWREPAAPPVPLGVG